MGPHARGLLGVGKFPETKGPSNLNGQNGWPGQVPSLANSVVKNMLHHGNSTVQTYQYERYVSDSKAVALKA
jgi:hypothetical protein